MNDLLSNLLGIEKIDFIYNYIVPIIDILIVAFIIYKIYSIISNTQVIQALVGILLIVFIYGFAVLLHLNTVLWIFRKILDIAVFALVIIFLPELRQVLTKIGNRFFDIFNPKKKSEILDTIFLTVQELSKNRIGALIAFEKSVRLTNFIETGTIINADISMELIKTIFIPRTPLHDGGIIIRDDKMVAAACYFNNTKRTDLDKIFGTRHRAALGLSEETDAVIIIVSEENGKISIAYNSKIFYGLEFAKFKSKLVDFIEEVNSSEKAKTVSKKSTVSNSYLTGEQNSRN